MDGLEATKRYRALEAAHISESALSADLSYSNIGEDEFQVVSLDVLPNVSMGLLNVDTDDDKNGVSESKDLNYRSSMSGKECISCSRRLPIIGMSANSDEATKVEALAMGMDFFVPKPFRVDKFLEVLNMIE